LRLIRVLRGVAIMTAVTFAAEIGNVRRFDNPRQLIAYLGLVPSESSTGERVRRGSITKSGNRRTRRVLVEGAWAYCFSARISPTLKSGSTACRSACQRLPGKCSFGSAAGVASLWQTASVGPSSWPQSHARCHRFFGRSGSR